MKKFVWKQSHMGGGGYITGLIQDPYDSSTIYTRCDVAGVFKSTNCGKTFRPINNGMAECHHHSVRSLAIDLRNSNVLFRCSGDARGRKLFGSIHKSADGGESWYEVCKEVDFYGNGPTRMYGEVVSVSPHDSSIVAAGGYSKGVFISRDGGESFSLSGLAGERITNVAFHPYAKDRLYICTVNDLHISHHTTEKEVSENEIDSVLEKLHDFRRKNDARIYFSQDCGATFEILCEGYNIAELNFDPENIDIIYAAACSHGILKSFDGGKTWIQKKSGLSDQLGYNTIAVDPSNPNILYTCPDLRGHHTFVPSVTIYKSIDKGESWNYLKEYAFDDFLDYPSYITIKHIGWAISKIRVDVKNPERLFMSNWYGMSVSSDGGKTWSGNNFEGTETTCIESVVCDPIIQGKMYFTVADHGPEFSMDNGITYKSIRNTGGFTSSTSVAVSRFRPEVLIYGAVAHRGGCSGIIRSNDWGKTLEVVENFREGLFVQALAEDYFTQGTFYAYVDGKLEAGAGLYKSCDWGCSWEKMSLQLPTYIMTLPHEKAWIEADLLPVVVYQVKNVCGTNQLLSVDPHRKGIIYLGEWTEGIFRTDDGGKTWRNIGVNLPFKQDKASVLNIIKTDENVPGRVYAGFIKEGLWRSEDYGDTWTKLYPQDDSSVNVSSLALGGKTGKEIYIASEPLHWTGTNSRVICSLDEGRNWTDIMDKSLGAIRWKGIAVDRKSGRVHAVSCGNGAFYGDFIQE
jgi:photosystem II stability/assembly factor-like uncharacterized protein